jgi:DNA-binding CsgD family transcriptional regulator
MTDYTAYYWQRDVWANRAVELGMGCVFASKDLLSDASLERTEFYQDWVRKTETFYVVGSVFPTARDQVAVLGIHRERALGAYDERDKALVAEFLPHLRRALQLRHRLSHAALERRATIEALDRTGTATLVVTATGHILYANEQADVLLRQGDGIHAVSGKLRTRDRAASERLSLAIAEAAKTAAGRSAAVSEAQAISREDRLPLTLLIAPMRPAHEGFGMSVPTAIVFIRDLECPTPSSMVLRGLFGLTPAEAAIAAALAEGKSVEDIAAAHRISLNTTRTHLKSILAKTGTRRQAELVALVLRTVAVLAGK